MRKPSGRPAKYRPLSSLPELTLLTVPACPHQEVFERRLALGLHGSPTLLIDGVDPFAARCAADG